MRSYEEQANKIREMLKTKRPEEETDLSNLPSCFGKEFVKNGKFCYYKCRYSINCEKKFNDQRTEENN